MLVIKGRYVRTHPISDGCQPSVIHEKYLKFEGCLPAEQCRPFWPWSTNQPTVFQVRHWPHSTLDPRRLLSSASLDCRWNSVRGPFSSQLDIKGMPARQHGGCEPGRTRADLRRRVHPQDVLRAKRDLLLVPFNQALWADTVLDLVRHHWARPVKTPIVHSKVVEVSVLTAVSACPVRIEPSSPATAAAPAAASRSTAARQTAAAVASAACVASPKTQTLHLGGGGGGGGCKSWCLVYRRRPAGLGRLQCNRRLLEPAGVEDLFGQVSQPRSDEEERASSPTKVHPTPNNPR